MKESLKKIKLFEEKQVRAVWDETAEKWWFSVVDVVAVLTDSVDSPAYWRKLKQRLKEEGNETVTNCHGLKMLAPDGKMRLTDVADTEQVLRLVQSMPGKKAEPFKLWLARAGSERIDETVDPASANGYNGSTQFEGSKIMGLTYADITIINSADEVAFKKGRVAERRCQKYQHQGDG